MSWLTGSEDYAPMDLEAVSLSLRPDGLVPSDVTVHS